MNCFLSIFTEFLSESPIPEKHHHPQTPQHLHHHQPHQLHWQQQQQQQQSGNVNNKIEVNNSYAEINNRYVHLRISSKWQEPYVNEPHLDTDHLIQNHRMRMILYKYITRM